MINEIKNIKVNNLSFLIIFTALIPYIGIPYLFKTDIQPICLLLSFIYLINKKNFHLNNINFISFIGLFTFSILATILCIFTQEESSIIELIRRLMPLFAAVVYFLTFTDIFNSKDRNFILKKSIDYFILIYFLGFFLNLISGDSITSIFVNRNIFDEELIVSRYVSFFAEPSRIPEQAYFAFLILFSIRLQLSKSKFLIYSIILIIISLLSGAGQIFFIIISLFPYLIIISSYFSFDLFFRNLNYLKLITLSTLGIFFPLVFNFLKESRGGLFFSQLIELGPTVLALDPGVQVKLSGFLFMLARLSLPEIIFSSPIDPYYILEIEPDLANKYNQICVIFTGTPYCPTTYSVYTSLGSYVVYFGFIGALFIMILYLFGFIKIFNFRSINLKQKLLITSLFFSYILTSLVKIPLANPAIFLSLCLFLNYEINQSD